MELIAEDPSIDAMLDDDFPQEEPEESGFPWLPVLGGTGAAVFLAAAAAILIRRKRNKPQEADAAWNEWEDTDSEPEDPGKTEE